MRGMTVPAGRTVTAILTHLDEDLGTVGPFAVDSPWWADVEPVAAHLRHVLGRNVAVVRLVDVAGGISPRDGHVTYHAELLEPSPSLSPVAPGNTEGIRTAAAWRAPWATGDGIRGALGWAAERLGEPDAGVASRAEQVKTWNLSVLFRIPTATDPVWLKVTPAFSAHEPAVTALIGTVDGSLVPPVLADDRERRRTLLAHVPGVDCWDASPQLIHATVTRWVSAQAALARLPQPPAEVLPDRRTGTLVEGLACLLDGDAGTQLDARERAAARTLLGTLPERIAALDDCGIPNSIVHGDFHPGNWRSNTDSDSDTRTAVLVDFADSFFGHPAHDGERLRAFVGPDRAAAVTDAWCEAWATRVDGCEPERALELVRPLQALSGAILYQRFLDHIEDSERRYHEGDPAAGIRLALAEAGL
jgi:Ser/Thr protein kinase RdoA (MazF antagonist)